MSLRHLPENIRIAAVKTPLSPRHNSRRMYHSVIKLRARLRFPSGSVRDGLLGLALGSYSGFSERGLHGAAPPRRTFVSGQRDYSQGTPDGPLRKIAFEQPEDGRQRETRPRKRRKHDRKEQQGTPDHESGGTEFCRQPHNLSEHSTGISFAATGRSNDCGARNCTDEHPDDRKS